MGNGYKVDLSALDEVIKKLNQVVDDIGAGPKTKAKYETSLVEGWLGKGFVEEVDVRVEHDEMKTQIESYVDRLQNLIVKFSSDTDQVKRNYDEREQQNADGTTVKYL